jgi:hypothetical protein
MNLCPTSIDGFRVICSTPLDERHRPTGRTRQVIDGAQAKGVSALAICEAGDQAQACYLFGCDADWHTLTDTWHESVEFAMRQAEFEYSGTSSTWRPAGP